MNDLGEKRVVDLNEVKGFGANATKPASLEPMNPIKKVVNLSTKKELNNVSIIKKDGTLEEYDVQKVVNAVKKSAARMLIELTPEEINNLCERVNNSVYNLQQEHVEIEKMQLIFLIIALQIQLFYSIL